LSNSIKDLKFTSTVQTLKPSRKLSQIPDAEPVEDGQEGINVQFQDALDNPDASESPLQGEDHSNTANSDVLSVPLRHSSLMVKFGVLQFKKSLNASMAPRWCSLNMFKFQIFARDQSTLLLCVLMATIERVESCFDSQSASHFPMLVHRKRKYRSVPLELIASSAEERQEWLSVIPRIKHHARNLNTIIHKFHRFSMKY
jgi:hypothetical protein